MSIHLFSLPPRINRDDKNRRHITKIDTSGFIFKNASIKKPDKEVFEKVAFDNVAFDKVAFDKVSFDKVADWQSSF